MEIGKESQELISEYSKNMIKTIYVRIFFKLFSRYLILSQILSHHSSNNTKCIIVLLILINPSILSYLLHILHSLKLCMKCHELKYFCFFVLHYFLLNERSLKPVLISIYHYIIKTITRTTFNLTPFYFPFL